MLEHSSECVFLTEHIGLAGLSRDECRVAGIKIQPDWSFYGEEKQDLRTGGGENRVVARCVTVPTPSPAARLEIMVRMVFGLFLSFKGNEKLTKGFPYISRRIFSW